MIYEAHQKSDVMQGMDVVPTRGEIDKIALITIIINNNDRTDGIGLLLSFSSDVPFRLWTLIVSLTFGCLQLSTRAQYRSSLLHQCFSCSS